MEFINNLIIDGNLTRDPELKETPKGTKVCNFSIAYNRFYRVQEETRKEVSFFDIEAWAREAESCEKNLFKGRGVRVIGRLRQDRWEDTEGKSRSKIKIVAEHVYIKAMASKREELEEVRNGSDDELLDAAA